MVETVVVVVVVVPSGMWGKERAPLSMDSMRLEDFEGVLSLCWVKVATTWKMKKRCRKVALTYSEPCST